MAPPSTAVIEAELLRSYLLKPASFPTIITLDEFRSFFPTKHQSHPQVKSLYRDLQFLRTVDTDLIDDNIAQECRNGERQRREMYRALHAQPHLVQQGQAQADGDKEVAMDEVFYGQTGSVPKKRRNHTKDSLLSAMQETIIYLEVDCQVVKRDADSLLEEMRQTVGTISDLGNAPSAGSSAVEERVDSEVVKDLKSLENAIDGSLVQR